MNECKTRREYRPVKEVDCEEDFFNRIVNDGGKDPEFTRLFEITRLLQELDALCNDIVEKHGTETQKLVWKCRRMKKPFVEIAVVLNPKKPPAPPSVKETFDLLKRKILKHVAISPRGVRILRELQEKDPTFGIHEEIEKTLQERKEPYRGEQVKKLWERRRALHGSTGRCPPKKLKLPLKAVNK